VGLIEESRQPDPAGGHIGNDQGEVEFARIGVFAMMSRVGLTEPGVTRSVSE
jgi:hypothetical protein